MSASSESSAAPYPDGTVVDHQLDVPKRAGLVLGEHGARHGAGRAQQQAALVPRDQRAPPQVRADEPGRPAVLVEGVPLVPQRHDVDGPAGHRGAEREERAVSGRSTRSEQEVRGGRAEAGHQPLPWGAARAPGRDNGRTPPRTYMISNPRARRRLGERRLPAASRSRARRADPQSAHPRPRPPLVLHRGAADAERAPPGSEHRVGGVRGQPSARGRPVRKCPGTSRAAAPLPTSGHRHRRPGSPWRPGAAARLRHAPSAGQLSLSAASAASSAAPPPGRRGFGEKLGLRPLGGAGGEGAARAGLGGSGGRGGRAAGAAPEPGRRRNINE